MPKKAVLLFTLLALVACLLSYKLGSVPVALAKARPAQQDEAERVPPPLPAPPAEWVVTNTTNGPTAAMAIRAGVAGVQHVADCVSFSAIDPGSLAEERAQLLDGTTLLAQWVIAAPPTTSAQGSVSLCGISVVGSVGNSMTLSFTGSASTVVESVNLFGHDAT